MFLGGFLAFIFGVLSDKIGRKKVFMIAWCFSIFGIITTLFSNNLSLTTFGNIFSWAGMDIYFSIVFIYCNEIIGGDLRTKSNAILNFSWASGEILINILNVFISNYKLNFIFQLIPLLMLASSFVFL